MGIWQERGLIIAESDTVKKVKLGWQVPSQSGNGTYIVNMDNDEPFCTCQHFETTHKKCQHIFAIEFIIQKENHPDGITVETQAVRVAYAQDWPIYNAVQTHEQERFPELLSELCKGIVQPVQKGAGRRNHLLSDIIMGVTCKVYSTVSGRRAMKDLRELQTKGFVTKALSYNSIFDYLENPALTPLLKSLIEESASPLRAIETDFAVDSSGFATTTYNRWFDHKWGKERSEAKWIKAHLICGVKTHIVTSAEVTATETADAPQFPQLVNATAKTFDINEVSADKAYSSKKNLNAVIAVNGTPYIPFKNYSKGSQGMHVFDSIWQRMWYYYNFNREAFLAHYHKRSNAETALSMIKMKFGSMVRAKTPVAQVNEVLCKILCHNICVLLESIYELGLEPTFWNCRAERVVARQLSLLN
jgi:transposase